MKCKNCKKEIRKTENAYFKGKKVCKTCFYELKNKIKYSASYKIYERKKKVHGNIKSILEKRYNKLVTRFRRIEIQKNSKTMYQYNVLVEMSKILETKKCFSYRRLGEDLELSLTSVKRLLSLKNCTPYTREQMEAGRITANKVMIITFEKGKKYQDEIVKWTIDTRATNQNIHDYTTNSKRSLVYSQKGIIRYFLSVKAKIIEYNSKLDKEQREEFIKEIKPIMEEINELVTTE